METITLHTTTREQMLDITSAIRELVSTRGWRDGALLLFCPHTTGALTVNEAADPDVARDMTVNMGRLVPRHGDYRHAEGNSDAHIKTSLFGPSLMLIVDGGEVRLGTWQGIYFCEWDGPRSRKLWAQWLAQ
ncbi:secondary thiamine-phosphate synthase enzyme YjbQ [Nitratidesulfovibrio vulgaris]|uniref:Secondary thiamine-phosphate synthase enzyme n=1 Tax=Nitratidesulfovibrio vulgaris (strain ATCC 29579 / DSM 644 / CCUG 34227 / NCIMB 8303 / VKM B-1760 / Hildenborough) TaxID=882 RepID=Q72ES0_NITV2|nr:secondary thiamine-phosphate synthase enzyme YjbQ [Nitratidesulfovibrio vulgaris]AAS94981.1 conserved hypothetical protein TIGR00149 [Nitratidesulfovibrio vulgaris str. Hildenborough]ADP85626.1 protein of unknown function UPF0047 [Nitratidesulfovibrio vulgaris RCH1]